MKKHAIIPIFIPHKGCSHQCTFCNQQVITAKDGQVTAEKVREIADTWLSTLSAKQLDCIEMAFYGGSFTGIPWEQQRQFLEVAKEYKDRGDIKKNPSIYPAGLCFGRNSYRIVSIPCGYY